MAKPVKLWAVTKPYYTKIMSILLFKNGLFTITTVIIFISCSSTENEIGSQNPFDGIHEIEISESLDINDESATNFDEFYFSSKYFHQMIIDNRGHYFIYNRGNESIYHLDENGEYIASIGRRGQGPGEFQSWPTFDTISSDTLYTLDDMTRIVSKFVYRNGDWGYDGGFTLQVKEYYRPSKILQIDREHLVIEYSPDVNRRMSSSENSSHVSKKYDLIRSTGEFIQENWLITQAHDRSIYSSDTGAGATHLLPFGGRSIKDIGPNHHLYHLWTPEFTIEIYDLEGSNVNRLTQPSFNYRLSDEVKQKRLDEVVSIQMGSEREQQELIDQILEEIPETAPALRDFHVDRDTGNVIVRRYIFEDQPNWMLLDKEGTRIGVLSLDENLEVFDFRNGKIIGALNNEDALPTVRVIALPQSVL